MRWTAALLGMLLVLAGCVTPLQPDNYENKFNVTQLAADQFLVDYSNWDIVADDSVVDFALLRSAEVTLQNGYHYFVMVDGESAADPASAEPPLPDVEYVMHDGMRYRLAAPGADNRIICFRENPAVSGYVALFVKASLRARYALDQTGTSI